MAGSLRSSQTAPNNESFLRCAGYENLDCPIGLSPRRLAKSAYRLDVSSLGRRGV